MTKMNKSIMIIFSVITLIIVIQAFINPYHVSGDCMEPAIADGQLCLLNRISPYLRKYQRGDIVVFYHEEKPWISRIVALETDTIHITDGSLLINGAIIHDEGIHRIWSNWKHGVYAIDRPLLVPLAHVYVLSDNLSAQHDDSRVFGPISTESIIGLVW